MNNDTDYGKIIARNLKRLCFEHGKTQADVARDLKISKTTLSSWMSGYRVPRMSKVDMLASYFNCKRSDILEPYLPKPLEPVSAVAESSGKHFVRILCEIKKRPGHRIAPGRAYTKGGLMVPPNAGVLPP